MDGSFLSVSVVVGLFTVDLFCAGVSKGQMFGIFFFFCFIIPVEPMGERVQECELDKCFTRIKHPEKGEYL